MYFNIIFQYQLMSSIFEAVRLDERSKSVCRATTEGIFPLFEQQANASRGCEMD
jgi:hypothetical protein